MHPRTLEAPVASLVLCADETVWLLWSWRHTIFFPTGDIRNDLYLTLEKGDFERGGKSVQKNIEVTMYVLYADGEILKVRLSSQFGMQANPEVILLLLWTCGLVQRSIPSGRTELRSLQMHSPCPCLCHRSPRHALIMTSSASSFVEILGSDPPSCSSLDLLPLVLSSPSPPPRITSAILPSIKLPPLVSCSFCSLS